MYFFCKDVRNGNHEFFEYFYDPGYAYGESEKCVDSDDVKELRRELVSYQPELMFWINFNEWAQEVYYDTYADPTNYIGNAYDSNMECKVNADIDATMDMLATPMATKMNP